MWSGALSGQTSAKREEGELLWHPWMISFCADGRRGVPHEACTQCSLLFWKNIYIHIQTLKSRAEPRAAKQRLVCFSGQVGARMWGRLRKLKE